VEHHHAHHRGLVDRLSQQAPAYARREYGVVIDERTWTIVPEETARLRAAAQTAR
jgi:hypothetical protein